MIFFGVVWVRRDPFADCSCGVSWEWLMLWTVEKFWLLCLFPYRFALRFLAMIIWRGLSGGFFWSAERFFKSGSDALWVVEALPMGGRIAPFSSSFFIIVLSIWSSLDTFDRNSEWLSVGVSVVGYLFKELNEAAVSLLERGSLSSSSYSSEDELSSRRLRSSSSSWSYILWWEYDLFAGNGANNILNLYLFFSASTVTVSF